MRVELAVYLRCLPSDIAALTDVELATLADVIKQRTKRR